MPSLGQGNLNPFTTGNPILGTKLLGFSIGRGSGALKGLTFHHWECSCALNMRTEGHASRVALDCECNHTIDTRRVYENTWKKCGELDLYLSPSARGLKNKTKKRI